MKSFNNKFRIEELLIKEVGSWKVSLRPKQPTIGSLVLSLARPCPVFSELTEEESKDLGIAFKVIEQLYQKTFKPQKINYLALMMVDEQVHYHVLPRYEREVEFRGYQFNDACWPVAHNLKATEITEGQLMQLLAYLKSEEV